MAGLGPLFVPAMAQPPPAGGLIVVTSPPGAQVMVGGEADLVGISPITFTYPLLGSYELTVKKYGYEDYRTQLLLDPAHPQQLNVELSPKTGLKAALRSTIIPGWGQRYNGHKTRSFAFASLFTGALVVFLAVDQDFRDREDDYLVRVDEYDDALLGGASIDELSARHRALVSAQEAAYEAESDRRIALGALVGIWGLNVLDAFLSVPDERATFAIKGVSVTPSAGTDGIQLTLSKAF